MTDMIPALAFIFAAFALISAERINLEAVKKKYIYILVIKKNEVFLPRALN